MAHNLSTCLSEDSDLAQREQIIQRAQDRIWTLADAVQGLQAAYGWEGGAADAFSLVLNNMHLPLRAQLLPLELAEQTVRIWRYSL